MGNFFLRNDFRCQFLEAFANFKKYFVPIGFELTTWWCFADGRQWWRLKWYSNGILSGQARFKSQDRLCTLHGSGGGTSGRAMAFCLAKPGSNPRTDLGFFQFRISVNLLLLGVQLFLIMFNRMMHTLPSSFLFPIIIYHCKINQLLSNKAYFFFSFSQ